jgi:ArsR family transcriptional regulator, arsenate/arsenite/antimonite-responsive transcriptional repressor
MKTEAAVTALAALAQETRLAIFRYLVRRGPKGAIVGDIRDELDIPNATLSFHLSTLKQAGLVHCRRDGRQLIHTADFGMMRELLEYLSKDCCAGKPEICADVDRVSARRR